MMYELYLHVAVLERCCVLRTVRNTFYETSTLRHQDKQ